MSASEPRSVATIFRTWPGCSAFISFAAFTTGIGQESPDASSKRSSLMSAIDPPPMQYFSCSGSDEQCQMRAPRMGEESRRAAEFDPGDEITGFVAEDIHRHLAGGQSHPRLSRDFEKLRDWPPARPSASTRNPCARCSIRRKVKKIAVSIPAAAAAVQRINGG